MVNVNVSAGQFEEETVDYGIVAGTVVVLVVSSKARVCVITHTEDVLSYTLQWLQEVDRLTPSLPCKA